MSPEPQSLNVSWLCVCVCVSVALRKGCTAVCAAGPEGCSGKYSKCTPTVCIVLHSILQVCVCVCVCVCVGAKVCACACVCVYASPTAFLRLSLLFFCGPQHMCVSVSTCVRTNAWMHACVTSLYFTVGAGHVYCAVPSQGQSWVGRPWMNGQMAANMQEGEGARQEEFMLQLQAPGNRPNPSMAGIVAHSYMKRYEKVRKSANQRRTGNYE